VTEDQHARPDEVLPGIGEQGVLGLLLVGDVTLGDEVVGGVGGPAPDAGLRDPVVEPELLVARQVRANVAVLGVSDFQPRVTDPL